MSDDLMSAATQGAIDDLAGVYAAVAAPAPPAGDPTATAGAGPNLTTPPAPAVASNTPAAAPGASASEVQALAEQVNNLAAHMSTTQPRPPGGYNYGPRAELEARARAQIGAWLDQTVLGSDRGDIGAIVELQQGSGLSGHQLPMQLMAAASTVTSGGDDVQQMATLEQVFATAMVEHFGVSRPMVGTGISSFPVVTAPTTGPAVATVGTAVSDTAVSISGFNLSPVPLTITATLGNDEISTFAGLESDVIRTLNDAIGSALDNEALNAAAGLFSAGTDPTTSTTVATFASVLAAATSAVDGKYSDGFSTISSLYGPASYRLLWSKFRGTDTSEPIAERLMAAQRYVGTSALVTAPGSDDDQEVLHCRNHMMRDLVQPIWSMSTIRDPYTLATSNQLRVTITLMHATQLLRGDNYLRSSMHLP